MESVEIKHYTVAQVRSWLEHNKEVDGLTNEVIRPAFAWALVHNPDVLDTDPIVAAIYDNGNLAASTCAFPEIMVKPDFKDKKGNTKRIWWFPMLWVKKQYEGKGYGLVVIGSLAEVYGMDCAWTAWAVQESIEIFEFLGCNTYYFPRYFMEEKQIRPISLKGKLAYFKQDIAKWWFNKRKPVLPSFDYSVRYLNNVDDLTYDFISSHEANHFFHWSKNTHNWHLQYPWDISAPLTERVPSDGEFVSKANSRTEHFLVQVWQEKQLVGVYVLRQNGKYMCIAEDSIYYENTHKDKVFASVVEHIKRLQITHFDTEDGELAQFIQKYRYFPRCKTENISLSISPEVSIPEHFIR
jgi:hypothetical protein